VLRGYIVAALWSTNNESTPERRGAARSRTTDEEDLTDAARDQLRAKVVKFLELASETDLTSLPAQEDH
jgi:hypothetical protein